MRDLFDSTVKADPISSGPQDRYLNIPKCTLEATSGLPPTSVKAAYLERLEASRAWMKDYHAKPGPVETIEEAK